MTTTEEGADRVPAGKADTPGDRVIRAPRVAPHVKVPSADADGSRVSQNPGSGITPPHPDSDTPGRGLPMRTPSAQRPLANLRHATVRAAAVRDEAGATRRGTAGVRRGPLPDPASARFRAENRVAALLSPGAIRAAFQPVVRLSDGAVVGYEALARTDMLDGSPDQWLEAASVVGLRVEVELACLEAATVAGRPPDGALLFVNASPATVLDPRMRAMVERLPRCVIEITEHDAVHDYDRLKTVLDDLRTLGCLVAVDDVGAGYASMAHVLALSPSFVKIDRSLVDGMHADPGRRALVQALQAFTAAIGGATIAEGVETVADLRELRALGVDLVQGFGVARPGTPWPALAPVPRRVPRPHIAATSADEGDADAELVLALAAAATRTEACEAVAARLSSVGGLFPMIYLDTGGVLRCQSRRGQWLVADGLQPGSGITGTAFVEGRELFVEDVDADPRYRVAVPGVCSELAVPLRVDGRVIGVVNVDAAVPLGQRTVDLVRRAALSLESRLAELPTGLESVGGLRGMGRHTRAIAGASDPQQVVAAVLAGVCELGSFDGGAAWELADGLVLAEVGGSGRALAGLDLAGLAELVELVDGTASVCTGGTDLSLTFAGTDALRDLGVRGALIVPIRDGRRVTDLVVGVSRDTATVAADAVVAAEELAVLAGARLGPMRDLRAARGWSSTQIAGATGARSARAEAALGERDQARRGSVPQQAVASPAEPARPGTGLALVPEFGLLDIVSDLAHAEYLEGSVERAVAACRRLRPVVERLGDVTTARYLRYTEAVSLVALARFEEAQQTAVALVEEVGGSGVWRCKALAVVAEAATRLGSTGDAITALADASWTLHQVRRGTYGHVSASLAVAIALRSAHLYERAEAVMRDIGPVDHELVDLLASAESAVLGAQWAGMLMLVGRLDEGRARAPRVVSLAMRTQRGARAMGRDDAVARAEVIEATGWFLLGEIEIAGRLAAAAHGRFEAKPELVETDLLQLVLGIAAMTDGRYGESAVALEGALRTAQAARRTVWETAARSALAELDVLQHGSTRATAMWRDVASTSLALVWDEREARFAALRGASSIRVLSDRVERHGRASQEDPLTGLGNRRFLDRALQEAPGRSVVFIDVDEFKEVNDGWSHAVGDRVLREVARVLRGASRADDLLARYGGDEFVAIPTGGAHAARELARRVHRAVEEHDWDLVVPGLRLTVSVGVGHAGPLAGAVESALLADHALHEAKRAGRNRVVEAAPTGHAEPVEGVEGVDAVAPAR